MRLSTILVAFVCRAATSSSWVALAQDVAEPETALVVEEEPTTTTTADDAGVPAETSDGESPSTSDTDNNVPVATKDDVSVEMPVQNGPFIDLFGPTLLGLEMTSPTTAQLQEMLTNEALKGKKVIGLYFSADWCGPCRQYTPELVSFYEKMNNRRGKKDQFEIVWVSRCRDVESYGQYFTHMTWLALPPQEAMGERGQWLGEKYGVKSIPSLILLDEEGNIITKDARTQMPKDKAGIGFPWRNPLSTLYLTVFPKSLRHIIKSNVASVKHQVVKRIQTVLRPPSSRPAATKAA